MPVRNGEHLDGLFRFPINHGKGKALQHKLAGCEFADRPASRGLDHKFEYPIQFGDEIEGCGLVLLLPRHCGFQFGARCRMNL